MLSLFKNASTIIIKTTNSINESDDQDGNPLQLSRMIPSTAEDLGGGYISYSLSMIHLLSLIESGTLDQIIIRAITYDDGKGSKYNWIKSVWSSDKKRISKCYDQKNYIISFKTANRIIDWPYRK
eukprot:153463_1